MDRVGSLGGTDVGALMGWSPWADALSVYEETIGISPGKDASEPMKWGTLLEERIAAGYSEEYGVQVVMNCITMQHPDHLWMSGTPDALAMEGDHPDDPAWGIEVKNIRFAKAESWGVPGTSDFPLHYVAQVAWYSLITGIPRWDVVVLVGGNELRVYHYLKNEKIEAALMETALRFWRQCIEPRIPPDMTVWPAMASRSTWQAPEQLTDTLPASLEAMALKDRWSVAAGIAAQAEEEIEIVKGELHLLCGTADGVEGVCTRSWRKGARRTAWKATVTALRKAGVSPDLVGIAIEDTTKTGEPSLQIRRVS